MAVGHFRKNFINWRLWANDLDIICQFDGPAPHRNYDNVWAWGILKTIDGGQIFIIENWKELSDEEISRISSVQSMEAGSAGEAVSSEVLG